MNPNNSIDNNIFEVLIPAKGIGTNVFYYIGVFNNEEDYNYIGYSTEDIEDVPFEKQYEINLWYTPHIPSWWNSSNDINHITLDSMINNLDVQNRTIDFSLKMVGKDVNWTESKRSICMAYNIYCRLKNNYWELFISFNYKK